MSSLILVHRAYGCSLWPTSENGPVAIIVPPLATSSKHDYEFIHRWLGVRNDLRFGTTLTKRSVVEVVGCWDGGPLPTAFPMRFTAAAGNSVIAVCAEAFTERRADLVAVINPAKTFPRWSLAKNAQAILNAAFGGGLVTTEEKLAAREIKQMEARVAKLETQIAQLVNESADAEPVVVWRHTYTPDQFADEILGGERSEEWVIAECEAGRIKVLSRRPWVIPGSEAQKLIDAGK